MGELSDIGVADLLYLLALRRQTGKLTISTRGDEATLFLDRGQLSFVSSTNMNLRLGRMLLRLGYLNVDQLREALKEQEASGRNRGLGKVLTDRGWISEEELARCVEEQCVEIVARVIAADSGMFVFQRTSAAQRRSEQVSLNSDRIILEATQRTDQLREVRDQLPDPSVPLMVNPDSIIASDDMTETETAVAATLQTGAKSLSELNAALAMDDLTLGQTVVDMIEREIILVGLGDQASSLFTESESDDVIHAEEDALVLQG